MCIRDRNEEEEILDKKPKVAVDEATMGDLLLGLGAAGGLLALKKGWDKFVKGSKLARTLAVTTKQKQKVAKDAKEKRDSEIDAADDVLADPNSSPRAIKNANKLSEIDRTSTTRDKTGVLLGVNCINPINGEKVPVFVGDYVLSTYGTGAVMGVPAHDERDFAFAKKYNLPIRVVISENGSEVNNLDKAYTGLCLIHI